MNRSDAQARQCTCTKFAARVGPGTDRIIASWVPMSLLVVSGRNVTPGQAAAVTVDGALRSAAIRGFVDPERLARPEGTAWWFRAPSHP